MEIYLVSHFCHGLCCLVDILETLKDALLYIIYQNVCLLGYLIMYLGYVITVDIHPVKAFSAHSTYYIVINIVYLGWAALIIFNTCSYLVISEQSIFYM